MDTMLTAANLDDLIGQKAPDPYDRSRLIKLEEEARKLREQIDAKEASKRAKLREWETIDRDANSFALRAELSEQQLRGFNGDGDAGGAAF